MPVYRLKGPDGRVYRVEGPDGATADELGEFVIQNYKQGAKPAQVDAPQSPLGSSSQNFMAGVGKAFVDTGRGIKQLIDIPAQALERTFGGEKVSRFLGMPTAQESAAATQSDIDEANVLDRALMDSKAGIAGNVFGQAVTLALPASKLSRVAGSIPKVGRYGAAAISGGAIGAAQPVATGDSRTQQAALGAAGGAAGQAIASGIGKIARGASQKISPEVAALYQEAQRRGIPVTADQLVNSKPLNALRATIEYVPFSGAGATREAQQKAFNVALSRTVGENADNVATALAKAESRLSGEFDNVLRNTNIKTTDALAPKLNQIRSDAASELDDAALSVINKQVDNILSKLDADGVLKSQAAYNVKKSLDRLSGSSNSSVAHWSREIRSTLMDELDQSLGEAGAKAFAKTREQWGNMRTLQKVLASGADGNVSPARLGNVRNIRSDDLSAVRDIGAQFLKGRIGDSGTAPRAAGMGALFGGALMEPTTAITAAGAGATVGRSANALLGSRAVQNYLLSGAPRLNNQYVNALLPLTGAALPNALAQK